MLKLIKEMIKPLAKYIQNKNLREFYRLYDKYNSSERFIKKKNVKFLNYIFDVADLRSFIYQFNDIFVEELYQFTSTKEDPLIIDCGSNIGTSCAYFKKMYPHSKIICFEADPEISEILQNNLIRNKIDRNISIINKAVWINENGVSFYPDGADGGSIMHYNSNNKKECIKIKSARLKDFLALEKEIDMLKMDIEGAELEVLMDCKNELYKVKNIFIEFHSLTDKFLGLSSILKLLEGSYIKYFLIPVDRSQSFFTSCEKASEFNLQINIVGKRKQ